VLVGTGWLYQRILFPPHSATPPASVSADEIE
jgi:hypothetical protein